MAGPALFLACEEMSRYLNASPLLVDGECLANCNNHIQLVT